MPAKNPWQMDTNRLNNLGLDVIHPVDQVDKDHYSRMEDVKSLQEGSITPRPGTSLINASALEPPVQEGQAVRVEGDGTASTNHSLGAPSYNFDDNKLYILTIHLEGGASVPSVNSGPSGGSIPWVLEARVEFGTIASPLSAIEVYRGMSSSGASTTGLSYTTDVACPTFFAIHEFVGVDTGGTSGSEAVVQSVSSRSDSSTSVTATLAAFVAGTSATFATGQCNDGNRDWTVTAPMSEVYDGGAGGTLRHTGIFFDGNDLTPESVLDLTRANAMIALELKAA